MRTLFFRGRNSVARYHVFPTSQEIFVVQFEDWIVGGEEFDEIEQLSYRVWKQKELSEVKFIKLKTIFGSMYPLSFLAISKTISVSERCKELPSKVQRLTFKARNT